VRRGRAGVRLFAAAVWRSCPAYAGRSGRVAADDHNKQPLPGPGNASPTLISFPFCAVLRSLGVTFVNWMSGTHES
jgi:hypothetical protein